METDIRKLPLIPDDNRDYKYICKIADAEDITSTHEFVLDEFHTRIKLWISEHKGDL